MSKYRDYFSIDENYFPSVNEDLLNRGLIDWTKFYPHETFIKLLKDTESVLSRNQKLSIWVEGAYGTGKSHAALTLKKLLDSSESEMKAYFEKYGLSKDLMNKIQGVKAQGTILTVHRYGSSDIHNDNDLIIAVQESIKKALENKKNTNVCEETLKGAIISWLSIEKNKNYFNEYLQDEYNFMFGGDSADTILEKLRTLDDKVLTGLVHNIFKVAGEIGISALKLDIDGLIEWIKNVIKANNLKYVVFFWDEFTEYFLNNKNSLTGFQKLIELSETEPFCFVIVTHKSEGLFHESDKDKNKILGRFVRPTCNIELPENMAFKLMGAAMQKKEDPQIINEWDSFIDDLNSNITTSRNAVMDSARISEDELKGILPIHPYTALILKYLSSAFDSNQRSMFDFIKNNRGDDVKAFQWYIDNYGFLDSCNLLTIDMLWDFFYDHGKEYLESKIRGILDSYNRQNIYELDDEHKRVFKTILILQAISQKVGDTVEIFIPNDKNLRNAYDGTDLESGRAAQIAEHLVREEIIYRKPMGQNKFQYSSIVNAGDIGAIEKLKNDFTNTKKTQDLVIEGSLGDVLQLSGALRLRYVIKPATVETIRRVANELKNLDSKYENNILGIITFAKDDNEQVLITKLIKEITSSKDNKILFIDTSLTPFGNDYFAQYVENLANSSYQRGKDNGLANQYDTMAKDILEKWKTQIVNGEFYIYTPASQQGERFCDLQSVHIKLKEINYSRFKFGIENFSVIGTMFDANSLGNGALCGAIQKVSGTYKSANPATKLENVFKEVWGKDNYWEDDKNNLIAKIKIDVENEISQSFKQEGRISIARIYDILKIEPYGFMPCNLTAFVLGFILKEYAKDSYTWSDGTNSDQMSPLKLKEMIEEIIKLQNFPNNRYKDKFIVKMSEEEKAFRHATASIFNFDVKQCISIEITREKIRSKMQQLIFPIWCVKNVLDKKELSVDKQVLVELIDLYCGVANSANSKTLKSDIDLALEIGRICIEKPTAVKELSILLNKDNCRLGMISYVDCINSGELKRLSDWIGDNGDYINVLKSKFDAEAAPWLWNNETVDKIIMDIILEYQIIAESNKIIAKSISFNEMIQNWCEKLDNFKLSFDTVKNDLDDYRPLFECLITIKRSGGILDNNKKIFLEQLKMKSSTFNAFWLSKQIELFKKKCDFQLNELSEEQINKVFLRIPHGVILKGNTEFMQLANSTIEDYKKELGRTRLRELWSSNTGTTTPREWSEKYKTPILCMIDSEFDKIKRVFNTINKNNPEEEEIEFAITFLQDSDIFNILNNSDLRERGFKNKIVSEYGVMLENMDDVRKELSRRLLCDVYEWYPNPDVTTIVKKFAEVKYNSGGCEIALQRIEEMDANRLKTYLKDLIRSNMTVGLQIINDK